jgi:hypothetical protein
MEASYATELEWSGQDERYSVACKGAYWVQGAKDMFKGGVRGGYMLIDLTSYKMVENLTKWLINYHDIVCS